MLSMNRCGLAIHRIRNWFAEETSVYRESLSHLYELLVLREETQEPQDNVEISKDKLPKKKILQIVSALRDLHVDIRL